MNEIWEQAQLAFSIGVWMVVIFYGIPYLIRKGWGDAESKTKKVCDVCFRDIKKFNETLKKIEDK